MKNQSISFSISSDRKTLTFLASNELRTELQEKNGHFSDVDEAEVLEPVLCNSELDWVNPSETGDLTDAPMVGIRDQIEENGQLIHLIPERWAYTDYQIKSFLEDLRDTGKAIFIS
jgi:hypothetical protein